MRQPEEKPGLDLNRGDIEDMKLYSCKICRQRGKRFTGTRRDVRHHIRQDHLIKSKKMTGDISKHESSITPNFESAEI